MRKTKDRTNRKVSVIEDANIIINIEREINEITHNVFVWLVVLYNASGS